MPQRILDSHCHAFPDHIAGPAMKALMAEATWMPIRAYHDGTLGGLLRCMDEAGIERGIMCSVATRPSQVRKITDWSASTASDRIIPFASIHPDFDAPEAEVERIASLGMKGLKFHPQYMNCAVDDPRCIRIARAAAKANLAFVLHAGYDLAYARDELGSPQRIRRLFEQAPGLRLLACHMGGWQRWQEVIDHLAGLPIWFETSFVFDQCPPDLLERMLSKHPAEYLLFGTDSPWSDQAAELAAFRALPLPGDVKARAMWENGWQFIGLQPPPPRPAGPPTR